MEYKLGKYVFKDENEYTSAKEDLRIIYALRNKYNLKDKDVAKKMLAIIKDGKIRFSSVIGRDFVMQLERVVSSGSINNTAETEKKIPQVAKKETKIVSVKVSSLVTVCVISVALLVLGIFAIAGGKNNKSDDNKGYNQYYKDENKGQDVSINDESERTDEPQTNSSKEDEAEVEIDTEYVDISGTVEKDFAVNNAIREIRTAIGDEYSINYVGERTKEGKEYYYFTLSEAEAHFYCEKTSGKVYLIVDEFGNLGLLNENLAMFDRSNYLPVEMIMGGLDLINKEVLDYNGYQLGMSFNDSMQNVLDIAGIRESFINYNGVMYNTTSYLSEDGIRGLYNNVEIASIMGYYSLAGFPVKVNLKYDEVLNREGESKIDRLDAKLINIRLRFRNTLSNIEKYAYDYSILEALKQTFGEPVTESTSAADYYGWVYGQYEIRLAYLNYEESINGEKIKYNYFGYLNINYR